MTSLIITKLTKNNTFKTNNTIIENSGLELELIQDFPFVKMWKVNNSKEFTHITNNIDNLVTRVSKVRFAFN